MLSEVLCFIHGNKYVHVIIADNINTTTGPICTRNPYRPWTNIDSRLLPTPHYNLNKKSYQYEPGAAVITYVFWKETSSNRILLISNGTSPYCQFLDPVLDVPVPITHIFGPFLFPINMREIKNY